MNGNGKGALVYGGVCVLLLAVTLWVTGCEGTSPPPHDAGKQPAAGLEQTQTLESVTVQFYTGMTFTDDDFQKIVVEPVQKQYPHITIQRMTGTIQTLLAKGMFPDVIQTHNGVLQELAQYGLIGDMRPLVAKHGHDVTLYDESVLNSLRTESGELLALPYAVNFTALYYNKAIFDQFGVTYPADGMTWDEAVEVARRVSRWDDGGMYRGLYMEDIGRLARQQGLHFADHTTMKSNMLRPEWPYLFELSRQLYTMPGMKDRKRKVSEQLQEFFDGKAAMLATVNLFDRLGEPTERGLQWDVAEYPSVPGKPHVNTDVDGHLLVIPPVAANKDAAMLVVQAVLSRDNQMRMTRETARLSPYKDKVLRESFAADMAFVKGKNIAGMLQSHLISTPFRGPYHTQTRLIATEYYDAYIAGEQTLEEALRNADQQINAFLSAQIGRK